MPRPLQNPVILLLLFFSSPAFALNCETAASLRAKVRDCEGNLAYASAGKSCLDSYDSAIAAARADVAKALESVLSADKQSQSMAHAKRGYETAIAALKALAEEGRRLGKQVDSYKQEIVFPDDFGPATQAGLSTEAFLENQPCYRDTRKLVLSYAELLALHAQELDLTRQIAEELAAKTFRGEQNLKPEDILPLLTSSGAQGSGKGAAPAKKGKGKSGESDITGTKKKKPL